MEPFRYQPLQLGQPGKPAIPDDFTEAASLICPACTHLMAQVSLQAVVIQLGILPDGGGGLASVIWQAQLPFLPMIAGLSVRFDAARVKNYTPGQAGQIILTVR